MAQVASETFAKIVSGLYLEGLSIDPIRDVIWYSDVIGGGVHGARHDGSSAGTLNADRQWTGGVYLNADGSILSSGERGIMWNNPDTGKSGWLIDEIEGVPINGVNEMVSDGRGGIIFGTSDIEMVIKGEATRPTRLYRLTAQREVILLADGIGFTNGLMFDQKRSRLYCNDTFFGTWVFDVDEDLKLSNKQCFLEKEDADGMALDALGNVWISGFRSNYIARQTPEGVRLSDYPAPTGPITQVRFGGADMRDVYLNSVPADGGDTLKEGGQITSRQSHLFKGRSETPGLKLEPSRFVLD